MKTTKTIFAIGVAAIVLANFPATASLTTSDVLQLYTFGTPTDNRTALEGLTEPMTVPRYLDSGLADATKWGSPTILVEAGVVFDPNNVNTWSDIFGVVNVG